MYTLHRTLDLNFFLIDVCFFVNVLDKLHLPLGCVPKIVFIFLYKIIEGFFSLNLHQYASAAELVERHCHPGGYE